jgi:hypothetical protein
VPLSTLAPLNRLVAVLQGLSGLQQVYVGVPESIGPQVAAYVALAGQSVSNETIDLAQREARYFVAFAYAVAGAEATAETTIAGLIDAFQTALFAERDSGMNAGAGPLVDSVGWDFSLGDRPDYQPIAGQEFRVWPCLVTVTQHAAYG